MRPSPQNAGLRLGYMLAPLLRLKNSLRVL